MNVGGLLGVNQALDQMFLDIWSSMLDLLGSVVATLLGTGDLGVGVEGGSVARLWPSLLGVALVVAGILFLGQLVLAALQPRRHVVRAVAGPVAFVVAVVFTAAAVGLVLGVADAVTDVVLREGAHVDDAAAAVGRLGIGTAVDGVRPVALGLTGMVVVLPLAVVLAVETLFRSAAILVLVATIPLTAAGLTNAGTRSWFGRAMRWLLATILIKPAVALTLVVGVAVVADTHPVGAAGRAGHTGLTAVLIGLGVLVVALAAPVALFRLLAVVEPGTASHDALRGAWQDARAGLARGGGAVAGSDIGSVLSTAATRRWGGDAGDAPVDGPGTGEIPRVDTPGGTADDGRSDDPASDDPSDIPADIPDGDRVPAPRAVEHAVTRVVVPTGGADDPGPRHRPEAGFPGETPHEAPPVDEEVPAAPAAASGWRRGEGRGLSGVM